MSNIKDGGPAFPQDYEHTKAAILTHQAGEISAEQLLHCARQLRGMTLRDYFAAEAMTSIISNTTWFDAITETASKALHVENVVELSLEVKKMCAGHAYDFADAMLKARQE